MSRRQRRLFFIRCPVSGQFGPAAEQLPLLACAVQRRLDPAVFHCVVRHKALILLILRQLLRRLPVGTCRSACSALRRPAPWAWPRGNYVGIFVAQVLDIGA